MTCRDCVHFISEPDALERLIPGLIVMGSARASVRADDGLCGLEDTMVSARYRCGRFSPLIKEDPGRP